MTVEEILVWGNISRTGAEIRKDLEHAGYAIVPIKPSEEMLDELARIGDGPLISGGEVWGYMLSAAKAHPEPEPR